MVNAIYTLKASSIINRGHRRWLWRDDQRLYGRYSRQIGGSITSRKQMSQVAECIINRFLIFFCVSMLCSALQAYLYGQTTLYSNKLLAEYHAVEESYLQDQKDSIYYAESWKKGTRQIKEQTLNIKLNAAQPTFEASIPDSSETYFYKLEIQRVILKTEEAIWKVQLRQSGNGYTLLQINENPGHVFRKEDYLDILYPVEEEDFRKSGYFGVPLSAKRVFKVENFYCSIQVKSYSLSEEKWRVIDSIEIEIEFTNNYKLGWRRT